MRSSNWLVTAGLAVALGACGPGWSRGMAAQDTGSVWGGRDTVVADPCRDKADDNRRSCLSRCDLPLNRSCAANCESTRNRAIAVCEGRTVDAAAFQEQPAAKPAAPVPATNPEPSPSYLKTSVH